MTKGAHGRQEETGTNGALAGTKARTTINAAQIIKPTHPAPAFDTCVIATIAHAPCNACEKYGWHTGPAVDYGLARRWLYVTCANAFALDDYGGGLNKIIADSAG